MMRKLPNFPAQLFEVLMLFLLDVEDSPLWHEVCRRMNVLQYSLGSAHALRARAAAGGQ